MTRILALAVIVAVAGLALYGGVTLFDETLQVGRMWETPGIKPHEKPIPVMAVGSVPWSEAGAIGTPPAVVNAVIDALHRGGYTHVSHIDMPVSPARVWAAMNAK